MPVQTFLKRYSTNDVAQQEITHFVPTVFVAIGGSGKDSLMRLRKRFYDENRPLDSFVRYVFIDTDMERWWPGETSEQDYLSVKPAPEEFVSCQMSGAQFKMAFELLTVQNDP